MDHSVIKKWVLEVAARKTLATSDQMHRYFHGRVDSGWWWLGGELGREGEGLLFSQRVVLLVCPFGSPIALVSCYASLFLSVLRDLC